MRARAVFGGLAFLTAVLVWQRPSIDRAASTDGRSTCEKAGAGEVCTAIDDLSRALRSPALPFNRAAIALPPAGTPGSTNPAISQANIDATICRPGFARSMRPPFSVTDPLKRRMMRAEHPGERMADYELDHLIPISLGGSPLDRRDLWLQPRRGQANAGDKNVLAYVLWRLVCERRVPLETAQRAISRDWTKAYQTYATPENVAKYHFRHAQGDHE